MSDKFEPLKLAAKRAADAAGIDEYELYYIEDGKHFRGDFPRRDLVVFIERRR